MKKEILICLILIVIFLTLVSVLFIQTKIHREKKSQFGHYNAETTSFIQKRGRLLFPEVIQPDMTIDKYDYYYQCAFFGDPSFFIFAAVSFETTSSFEKEKQRIINNSDLILSTDNREIYMTKNSSNMDYYWDNVVYDGLSFFIECAVVFDDEHIEYLYTNWQDSAEKNEYIDTFFQQGDVAITYR